MRHAYALHHDDDEDDNKRSSATAEIARDADDVDFSVDNVHSDALTLARTSKTDGTDEPRNGH